MGDKMIRRENRSEQTPKQGRRERKASLKLLLLLRCNVPIRFKLWLPEYTFYNFLLSIFTSASSLLMFVTHCRRWQHPPNIFSPCRPVYHNRIFPQISVAYPRFVSSLNIASPLHLSELQLREDFLFILDILLASCLPSILYTQLGSSDSQLPRYMKLWAFSKSQYFQL